MYIVQDYKYEIQEIMIKQEDLNDLAEWISVTEEKVKQFYDLVERLKAYFDELNENNAVAEKIDCKKTVSSQEWKKDPRSKG